MKHYQWVDKKMYDDLLTRHCELCAKLREMTAHRDAWREWGKEKVVDASPHYQWSDLGDRGSPPDRLDWEGDKEQ